MKAGDRLVFLTDGILERNAADSNALEILTPRSRLTDSIVGVWLSPNTGAAERRETAASTGAPREAGPGLRRAYCPGPLWVFLHSRSRGCLVSESGIELILVDTACPKHLLCRRGFQILQHLPEQEERGRPQADEDGEALCARLLLVVFDAARANPE